MTDVLARLFEPDVMADPGPFYRWVRENHPIQLHPAGFYLVSTHAHASWMFRGNDLRAPETDELPLWYPRAVKYRSVALLLGSIAMTNPPTHTRLRRLVIRDFTAKRVEALRPGMTALCDELLDAAEERLRDGDTADLHGGLARELSMQVIADLLGVPAEDRHHLAPLVLRVLQSTSPISTDDMLADADAATHEVESYFTDLIARLRVTPGDNLFSDLVSAHYNDPDQLTDDELMSMVWGLWAGGFETSAAGIDNAIIALLRHPEQSHWLRRGQAEVRAFTREALRFDPPNLLTGVVRVAAHDTEVGGMAIPEGATVRALPACANRDPAAFTDPDSFLPERDGSASLTFGQGMHYCLGASLARAEVEVVLPRLHARFPELQLAGEPERRRSLPLRTCDRLLVTLQARPGEPRPAARPPR
ncbi:cytochrome P450 [Lentzea tibetensis]|uniref:Cytochrome P450 n=1 Tax=Lentzea tibetensis TaxID=2591470 RepID=A0A563EJM3_9PSEU|nr:cytochrome P450 [Lentzea tibetensis]TWP46962.1 cytochrome P450 [Lentzea tibetensis]